MEICLEKPPHLKKKKSKFCSKGPLLFGTIEFPMKSMSLLRDFKLVFSLAPTARWPIGPYIPQMLFPSVHCYKLKTLGANLNQLKFTFVQQARSVLEVAVPAWHPGLTVGEKLILRGFKRASEEKWNNAFQPVCNEYSDIRIYSNIFERIYSLDKYSLNF